MQQICSPGAAASKGGFMNGRFGFTKRAWKWFFGDFPVREINSTFREIA